MRIAFLYNEIYRNSSYGQNHPITLNRVSNVFDLAKLLNFSKVDYIYTNIATFEQLAMFHDEDYIKILKNTEKNQKVSVDNSRKYNIGTPSNPIFKEMYKRHASATGSLLLASNLILKKKYSFIFSPGSGAHHGKKNKASGFCYFNDIATCIIYLKKIGFKKILYFDMDAHYGDGVVEHFRNDKQVLTISLHQEDLWPNMKNYEYSISTINIPLKSGFNDKGFKKLLLEKLLPSMYNFNPDVSLLQMGADCLKEDHMSKLCFSNNAMSFLIKTVKSFSKNIIVMGGGGYNPWITLRAWIYNLATLADEYKKLNLDTQAKLFLKKIVWKNLPEKHWIETIKDSPNIFEDNFL